MDRRRDRVTRPVCCMDADGLFMGDATLRKIFCLQETLRGVRGRPPLTESLLQPDRVLFLPSPLLREQTAVLETPNKQAGYHLTPTLFQLLLQMEARTHFTGTYVQPRPSEVTQETQPNNLCELMVEGNLLNILLNDMYQPSTWYPC